MLEIRIVLVRGDWSIRRTGARGAPKETLEFCDLLSFVPLGVLRHMDGHLRHDVATGLASGALLSLGALQCSGHRTNWFSSGNETESDENWHSCSSSTNDSLQPILAAKGGRNERRCAVLFCKPKHPTRTVLGRKFCAPAPPLSHSERRAAYIMDGAEEEVRCGVVMAQDKESTDSRPVSAIRFLTKLVASASRRCTLGRCGFLLTFALPSVHCSN